MMRKPSLLTKERILYWPGEFSEIVDLLTKRGEDGRSQPGAPFTLNVGVIAMAAALGLREGRKREVGANRKEISSATFHMQGLELYLLLIPVLSKPEAATEALRPENEEATLKEFERFAAGGLEVLAGEFERSAGREVEVVLHGLLKPIAAPGDSSPGELPDLL
jgi:hypothetical protein